MGPRSRVYFRGNGGGAGGHRLTANARGRKEGDGVAAQIVTWCGTVETDQNNSKNYSVQVENYLARELVFSRPSAVFPMSP